MQILMPLAVVVGLLIVWGIEHWKWVARWAGYILNGQVLYWGSVIVVGTLLAVLLLVVLRGVINGRRSSAEEEEDGGGGGEEEGDRIPTLRGLIELLKTSGLPEETVKELRVMAIRNLPGAWCQYQEMTEDPAPPLGEFLAMLKMSALDPTEKSRLRVKAIQNLPGAWREYRRLE